MQVWVENGPVVSEKSRLKFSYVNDIEPRSRNDIDLQYQRQDKLPAMYWLPKLHKRPYKDRFICTTT